MKFIRSDLVLRKNAGDAPAGVTALGCLCSLVPFGDTVPARRYDVLLKDISPRFVFYVFLIALNIFLSGCATVYNPVTGVEEVALVDTASEVSMGERMAREVARAFPLSRDPGLNHRLMEIGNNIARVSDRQDLIYHFSVIQGREINAFTLPGGFIYVFSGLMERVDDDELAVVLAHEVGHVAARHPAKKMEIEMGYEMLDSLIFGRSSAREMRQIMNIFYNIAAAGYERNDELWADRLSIRYTKRAGYNPEAAVRFMKKLQTIESEKGTPAYTLLSSHPPLEERIRNAEAELAKPASSGTSTHPSATQPSRPSASSPAPQPVAPTLSPTSQPTVRPAPSPVPPPSVRPQGTKSTYRNIKICPICHREYPPSFNYCTKDGSKLE